MASKFFGYLTIVVGVFICFAGACFTLFGAGVEAIFGLFVGVALIVVGRMMLRANSTPPE